MILSTNFKPITFTGKSEPKQANKTPDTGTYADLLRHHELVSIALDTENKEEKVVAVHINPKGKLPITIWRPFEGSKEILISDHNFRNGTPFLVKPNDPNYGRIKGLMEHHIRNYERDKQTKQGDVSFTGALKAQALLKI